MRQFLHSLIEKHDPQPAGRETVASLIVAGEEGVAVEILVENYYEHDVALTVAEQSELRAIAMRLDLSQDYLAMINDLPVDSA